MQDEPNDISKSSRAYLQYSGIAAQMGLTIAAFAFLGVWLDGKFATDKIFTAILALLGVLFSLYAVIRQISKQEPPAP
jgi:F0F1-type ATP synthase assembly protein I